MSLSLAFYDPFTEFDKLFDDDFGARLLRASARAAKVCLTKLERVVS
jgi:hypothetical protein